MGLVMKPNVRSSLQKYTRLAVDWLDVMTSHRVSTKYAKYAKYDMFDTKYLPENTNNKYVLDQCNLQPTSEMDSDSTVYQKQSYLLNIIKSKCLSSIEQVVVPRELDNLRTPQKITFQTPKTPKN